MGKRVNLFAFGNTNEELINELPPLFEKWEKAIAEAEPFFDIDAANLESLARTIPHHQVYYAQHAQDARAVVKWLENIKSKHESIHIRNYNNMPRALGAREQTAYIAGEKNIVELNQLIIEATLKQQHFEEIVEAIKQMGWMLTNIVKLRVSEIKDAIV